MPLAVTRSERFFLALLALLLSLGLAVLWLASQNLTLRQQNSALRTERELAEVAYRLAQNQLSERSLLAETLINDLGRKLLHSGDLARLKVTALVPPSGTASGTQVIAVWDPAQQAGLLTGERLPAIAEDHDYQIWMVDPAYPAPINAGVFHAGPEGSTTLAFKPDRPVTQVAGFALSVERKGGVPRAEGPIVFLSK
jgi:uncharacterized membrane protein YciS (DUF1049 family)